MFMNVFEDTSQGVCRVLECQTLRTSVQTYTQRLSLSLHGFSLSPWWQAISETQTSVPNTWPLLFFVPPHLIVLCMTPIP